ncbi:hypothetical protein AB0892_13350 [Streptomyces sp. NPDC005409]|uniref:hypothetical protein n=1 Tax=Streptomyces sp. NPDC005409 TaxID=3155342 RepID=UPI003456593C
MSTHRSRRIDHDTAEQLLGGARADLAPGHEALAGLLAALSAPTAEGELAGEEQAVAMFRAARLHPAPAPAPASRRWRSRSTGSTRSTRSTRSVRSVRTPAMLLSAKVAAAALAAAAVGGVAVAAGSGHLPAALGGGSASGGPTPSASAAAGKPGEPSAGLLSRPSTPVTPALADLCRAYAAADGAQPAVVLADHRFAPLVAAAGGQGAVPDYCGPVVDAQDPGPDRSPAPQPTDGTRGAEPTKPGGRDASKKPDKPGPGATRTPDTKGTKGTKGGHPTAPATTEPSPPRKPAPTGRPNSVPGAAL